jgi:hypothetical protein
MRPVSPLAREQACFPSTELAFRKGATRTAHKSLATSNKSLAGLGAIRRAAGVAPPLWRQLWRAVRTRGHFPTDEATKLLYLVLRRAAAGWKMPPREWHEAKTQFAIMFGDRFVSA